MRKRVSSHKKPRVERSLLDLEKEVGPEVGGLLAESLRKKSDTALFLSPELEAWFGSEAPRHLVPRLDPG